ncbi:MAG: SDR family oxidoreductase [Bacteroidota bacterium]
MKTFQNKTILITGGAHGIGRSLALAFAETGSKLVLVDWDKKGLDELGDILQKKNTRHWLKALDLRDLEGIQNLPAELKQQALSPDILINNAGVSIYGPLQEISHEDIDWIAQINYLAPFHLTKVLLPGMLEKERGHVVNISSAAGLQGFPNRTGYCASKSGLRGFSEALRAELWGSGIGVTIVHPGPVNTDMPARSRMENAAQQAKELKYMHEHGQSPDVIAQKILRAIRRNQPVLLCSAQAWWLAFLKRLFPNRLSDVVGRYRERLPI